MALDDFEKLLADKPRNERWELIGGRVVRMMVGVRWEHARIVRDIEPGATSVENPTFLVEVLSPGTEARDRFEKWAVYQQLASLQHDVLVARDRPHLEVFDRVEGAGAGSGSSMASTKSSISRRSRPCCPCATSTVAPWGRQPAA